MGFEPTISVGERPQTYALVRAVTETGTSPNIQNIIFDALAHWTKHFKVQEKCFLDVTSV